MRFTNTLMALAIVGSGLAAFAENSAPAAGAVPAVKQQAKAAVPAECKNLKHRSKEFKECVKKAKSSTI